VLKGWTLTIVSHHQPPADEARRGRGRPCSGTWAGCIDRKRRRPGRRPHLRAASEAQRGRRGPAVRRASCVWMLWLVLDRRSRDHRAPARQRGHRLVRGSRATRPGTYEGRLGAGGRGVVTQPELGDQRHVPLPAGGRAARRGDDPGRGADHGRDRRLGDGSGQVRRGRGAVRHRARPGDASGVRPRAALLPGRAAGQAGGPHRAVLAVRQVPRAASGGRGGAARLHLVVDHRRAGRAASGAGARRPGSRRARDRLNDRPIRRYCGLYKILSAHRTSVNSCGGAGPERASPRRAGGNGVDQALVT
jgi:hypothetical protein